MNIYIIYVIFHKTVIKMFLTKIPKYQMLKTII